MAVQKKLRQKSDARKREFAENDRLLVKRMASIGIPHEDIARSLKTTGETLRKYFAEELATAMTEANVAVAGALFRSAIKGNVSAQIFWCKTRLRWKEVHTTEVTGPDGAPLKSALEIIDRPPRETFEEWEARRKKELEK
jgi:hypothetical protein